MQTARNMKDDNDEIWSLSKLGNVLGMRYFIRSSKSRGWRERVENGGGGAFIKLRLDYRHSLSHWSGYSSENLARWRTSASPETRRVIAL